MPKDGHTGYLNLVVTLNNGMVVICVGEHIFSRETWCEVPERVGPEGRKPWLEHGARGCLLNKLRCDFVRHTYAPFGVKKQLVESDAGKMYLITVSQLLKMCFREMLYTCSRI
jgi:hypothetical protein